MKLLDKLLEMVDKIEYENFLLQNGTSVYVTNSLGQRWELKRVGISESEVQNLVKEVGKTDAVKLLVDEGKLVPVYGGNLNL